MVGFRLPNWQHLGLINADRPDNKRGVGRIYEMGKERPGNTVITFCCPKCDQHHLKHGMCQGCNVELRRVEERVPEDEKREVDEDDAKWLDILLASPAMAGANGVHRKTILRYYGTFYRPPEPERYHYLLPAAVRALLDAEARALGVVMAA
jgi:hypothetical protein